MRSHLWLSHLITPKHLRVDFLPSLHEVAKSSPLRSPPLFRVAQCTWRCFVASTCFQVKSFSQSPSGHLSHSTASCSASVCHPSELCDEILSVIVLSTINLVFTMF